MRNLCYFEASILAASLIFGSRLAIGADMDVFGIPLGTKFEISECEKKIIGNSVMYRLPKSICYERVGLDDKKRATTPVVNEKVLIKFPISETPTITKNSAVLGIVLEGNLEGIGFDTTGVTGQTKVLNVLKQKYGEPTQFLPRKVQNRMGATYDVFDASWSLPELDILFQSVAGKIDSGLVVVDTKKGSEYRKQILQESTIKHRPM